MQQSASLKFVSFFFLLLKSIFIHLLVYTTRTSMEKCNVEETTFFKVLLNNKMVTTSFFLIFFSLIYKTFDYINYSAYGNIQFVYLSSYNI